MSEQNVSGIRRAAAVSDESLERILSRHGLQGRPVLPMPGLSAGNTIYLLGDDLVLRIPHERDSNDFGLHRIAAAVSEARRVGVRTPEILAFDDSREFVAVPYVIMERVHGEPLSKQEVVASDVPQVWRELGRDLALLHNGVRTDGLAGEFESGDVETDPRPWLEGLAADGLLSAEEAMWLRRWLDELQPLVCRGEPFAFCHGDMNADNILVRPDALEYLAVVDWDGAGWMDPAWDFVPLPLGAVPFVLQAYREVAEVPRDSTVEARILWHHIQYTLFRWWHMREQGRSMIDRGFERLRPGISEMLKLPGARWMSYLA